uniref:Uncharacterized protein n=1 Tax=viral metagenome TaxID=1070528 RepID=A0A6M3M4Y1_9ZZZZ
MIKGDYDRLKELAKFNMCAEHHTPLEVAWSSSEKSYFLRCGVCEATNTLTRQLSLTQEYKAGADIPEPIKSNIEKARRRRQMQQGKQDAIFKLEGIPNKDLATGEMLLPEQVKALMDYAFKYHLDPFRGHLVLMYGKPYITIDGYLYHAFISRQPYTLSSRPMLTQEEKQYKIGKTDHGWLATVTFTESGNTFTGTGIVTYEEMTTKSPRDNTKLRSPVVAFHPWQLAQKRAEWQALRRAFPIGESQE